VHLADSGGPPGVETGYGTTLSLATTNHLNRQQLWEHPGYDGTKRVQIAWHEPSGDGEVGLGEPCSKGAGSDGRPMWS
jgi:hypothetical protein